MIALVASVILAIYIVIPGLLSRFVYRLFVPLRVIAAGRTEEATRAIAAAILPFLLALIVVWHVPVLNRFPIAAANPELKTQDYELVFSSLYSEAVFVQHSNEFWQALDRSLLRQGLFVFWYYLLTALATLGLGYMSASYGKLGSNPYYRWFADKFLFPRISEWHPLLTPFVFADKQTVVRADILTTTDNLYRGRISEHFIDPSGRLTGLILTEALRFDRRSYLREKDAGQPSRSADFWKAIPGAKLYIFADKIINLNLNYEPFEPSEDVFAKFIRERLNKAVRIEITSGRRKRP